MGNIQDLLAQILSARYGRDVRQSIHDAIETCYEDGHAGAIDLQAREDIAQANELLGNTDISEISETVTGAVVALDGAVDGLSDRIDAIDDELSASASGAVTDQIWTSGYYNFLTKNGNVVSLVAGGATASPVTITSETVLFKVPEGFRPKNTIRFLLTFQVSTSGALQIGAVNVSPNGEAKREMTAGTTQEIQVVRVFGAWGV